jgi:hypothetical protein
MGPLQGVGLGRFVSTLGVESSSVGVSSRLVGRYLASRYFGGGTNGHCSTLSTSSIGWIVETMIIMHKRRLYYYYLFVVVVVDE